jgi:hypothetical protein
MVVLFRRRTEQLLVGQNGSHRPGRLFAESTRVTPGPITSAITLSRGYVHPSTSVSTAASFNPEIGLCSQPCNLIVDPPLLG